MNTRLNRQAPSRRVIAALGAVLLIVTLPVAALCTRQAAPAALSGTIYDVMGGVMPGVQVTLVSADGAKRTATSGANGTFAFPAVAPGTYVIETALPGFRALRQEVELRDTRDWDRAITLQIGDLRESISVSATRITAPAPAPEARRVVRVGGSVRAPRKTLDVKPVFPASMREAGRSGIVPLEAMIGRDGTVTLVRVVSAGAHPDFAVAAVDAVRQWRFTPTLLNGQPVDVVMSVTVRFDLE